MAKHSSSIELRHLRYFVAAAEHGSFRKAGNVLEMQESAVSRSIRDLEDHLGASLFNPPYSSRGAESADVDPFTL